MAMHDTTAHRSTTLAAHRGRRRAARTLALGLLALTVAACGADGDGDEVSAGPVTTAGPTATSTTESTTTSATPSACDTTGWQTFKTTALSFQAPPGVVDQHAQGIDSLVGSYEGEGLEVSFDFGMYSGWVLEVGKAGTSLAIDVDGFDATLMTAEPGQVEGFDTTYMTAMHVPGVESDAGIGSPAALDIYVQHDGGAQAATAECIVRSVDFETAAEG